jgi:DNA-binding helix-hairpin-helix protein with protein kinase domain
VLVASNATVRLVDCDSFQVSVGGRTYFCHVGVPIYQPPELQDKKTFRGLVRAPNHDNFGLAILIFQLLFIARHPFCGRYSGTGEMPIERAIKEYRYAYGSAAQLRQVAPPPGALPREAVADHVAQLFERAFGPNGTKPGRPDANEWTKALDALEAELRVCDVNTGHYYLKTLNGCPICAIERSAGVILFLPPLACVQSGITFNLASIWGQIEGVASPGPAPHVPQPTTARATGIAANAHDVKMLRRAISVAIFLGIIGLWMTSALTPTPRFWLSVAAAGAAVYLWNWANAEQRQTAKRHFDQVSGACRAMMERWKHEAGDTEFQRKKSDLVQAKREYERLPELRRQRLQELERRKRQLQLDAFLDRFEIDKAKIPGIGPGRKAVLESNGIETAADVTHAKITGIPGFGDNLAQRLIKWRQTIEQKFVFDPNKAIDRSAVAAVENDVNNLRLKLEDSLRKGQAELLRIRQTALTKRETMLPRLEEAVRESAQAEANYKALS